MPTAAWVQNLLDWFSENKRPMPWRDDPSPYKVWISEVMLQQTQVAAVIPYFERFLSRFPDVQTLAEAAPQDVLKQWEGLGYYSRARHLQEAARCIAGTLQGRFPSSCASWKELPGIGDYTAAAIASIAFGEAVPAVDGNVLRIGSRVRGIRTSILSPAVGESIRTWLKTPLRTADPSSFNQAMMELGALVCRPRNPRCGDCPLHRNCAARRQGLTAEIPFKPGKPATPHYTETAAIIHDEGGRVLLRHRPAKGLLGGMWEFPGERRQDREPLAQTIRRGIGQATGMDVTGIRKRGIVRHAFSHFTQTIHVFECQAIGDVSIPPAPPHSEHDQRWYAPGEIAALPLSKAHRIIAGLT
jgi:A/G-specific adenine glycosylase